MAPRSYSVVQDLPVTSPESGIALLAERTKQPRCFFFFQGLKEISSEWTKETPQIDLKSHFDCKETLSRNDDSVQDVVEYEDCSIHSCSRYHDVALLWLLVLW